MNIEIVLRLLSFEHVELLRRWRNQNRFFFIHQQTITKRIQKNWFKRYKEDPHDTIYIVYYQFSPVGVLGVTEYRDEIEIGRLMLGDKRYEKRGIMTGALELIISKYRHKKLFLKVIKTNVIAQKFYNKNKFVIVGEEKNWYIMKRYTI